MAFSFAPTASGTGGTVNMSNVAGSGTTKGTPFYQLATGTYTDSVTGLPFSGTWAGQTFSNGALAGTSAATGQPGSAAPTGTPGAAPTGTAADYTGLNVPKSPAEAADVNELQQQFASNASSALQNFSSYLNDFNSDISNARSAAATAQNIQPTVNALTSAQGGYAQNLAGANTAYQNALNTGAANANNVIATEQGMLPSYDQAVNNVGNLEIANLGPQMARYAMASGVPGGASSATQQIEAGAVANIAAPLELQKIQQAYGIQNQNLGVQELLGQRGITYAGQFLPGQAGALYSSQTGLANAVQSLKNQTAAMTFQDALKFMQAAGVPASMQAQVLGVNIGMLSQLEGAYGGANYQGLQYLPGALTAGVQGFSNAMPGYPTYPSTAGTRTGGGMRGGYPVATQPNLGSNAPQNVGGTPTTAGTDTTPAPGGYPPTADPATGLPYQTAAGQVYDPTTEQVLSPGGAAYANMTPDQYYGAAGGEEGYD